MASQKSSNTLDHRLPNHLKLFTESIEKEIKI